MNKYILLLIFIPIIGLSQNSSIFITGSSTQNNGTELLTIGDGEYIPSKIQGRTSSLGLYLSQDVNLLIGNYTLVLGASYEMSETNYDFSESNPIYANYAEINNTIIPLVELRYRVLQLEDLFHVYASAGAMVFMESLSWNYTDNIFEPYDYDYNYLWPFIRLGVDLDVGLFNVEPFISYQMDPIYFDDFSEIEVVDLENAFEEAGIVTGINFSLGFGF